MSSKDLNILLFISLFINFYGYFSDSPLIISFAQIALCFGFVIEHYQKFKLEKINPIIIYATTSLIPSYGHFMAFYNIEEKEGSYFQYFKYSIPDNFSEAMEIFYLGIFFVIIGFKFGMSSYSNLKSIKYEIRSISLLKNFFFVSIFLVFFSSYIKLPGSLNKVISIFPLLSIFLLNIIGKKYNYKSLENYSLILTITCSINAFFTSYLRNEIIIPLLLYLISTIIVKKNFKLIFEFKNSPILFMIILFSLSFNKLGKLRTYYSFNWEQKLEYIFNDKPENYFELEDEDRKQTILSRSTVINQLSQVVRVKKEDGLYYGNSLFYLSYAFIPRFIWPEKPIIQQGAWFAERIGMAYRNSLGVVNNSINMTIFGEAYLNFDFYGVVVISFLFGLFFSKLWQSSGELNNYFNIVGIGYSLYLITFATFQLGADLQSVVTLISVYLIFMFMSIALKEINS